MAGLGGNIDPANLQLYANSQWYMSLRWQELSQLGVRFVPVDLDSVFRYVAQHPTAFGFTAQSVLATSAPLYNTPPYTAILAGDHYMSQEQQQTYLFIDGKHLTTAGQTIEADYEYSLLVAPSHFSLLAETVVQGGWARVATIQGQIDASMMQCRGPSGTNLWASMGAYGLKIKNAPGFSDESGLPYGGTVGIDYQLFDGFLIRASFLAGSQTQDFSTGGGFDETNALRASTPLTRPDRSGATPSSLGTCSRTTFTSRAAGHPHRREPRQHFGAVPGDRGARRRRLDAGQVQLRSGWRA